MEIMTKVKERLKSLGYEASKNDEVAINFALEKNLNSILRNCNQKVLPADLEVFLIDRVCGDFLYGLLNIGALDENFDIEAAVKSVQAGDTTVTFDNDDSNFKRLENLIEMLQNSGEREILCLRKMLW